MLYVLHWICILLCKILGGALLLVNLFAVGVIANIFVQIAVQQIQPFRGILDTSVGDVLKWIGVTFLCIVVFIVIFVQGAWLVKLPFPVA